MSQQPPYGRPSHQPQRYARRDVPAADWPAQPRFIPREPDRAQTAYDRSGPPTQCFTPQQEPLAYQAPAAPTPRKKRRVFMWVFFAVQVIFIIWLISAGVTTDHSVTHCTGVDCKGATEAGSAIGVALIVVFWVVVDLLLAIPYAIYRLAARSRQA
jgi:hypothetical protein